MKRKIWISLLLLLILHQICQYGLNIQLAWIDNYLDAALFMPILLPIWQYQRNMFYQMKPETGLEYFSIGLVLTIIAELIFPLLNVKCVGDPIDAILYLMSGFIVWKFFIKPK